MHAALCLASGVTGEPLVVSGLEYVGLGLLVCESRERLEDTLLRQRWKIELGAECWSTT